MTSQTGFDLIFRNARLWPGDLMVAIGIRGGKIAAIEPNSTPTPPPWTLRARS